MNTWSRRLRSITSIFTLTACLLFKNSCDAGSWALMKNSSSATEGVTNPLLLTDGTVLCTGIQGVATGRMWKLTPDIYGSYINGTWSQMASLPVIGGVQYAPFAFASAVLATGNVVYIGGEYNGNNAVWTTLGATYDTLKNVWTPLSPPPNFPDLMGDAQSAVLFDGTFMVASPYNKAGAVLNPKTYMWTAANMTGKVGVNDEEGWTLLPNGNILAVNCGVFSRLKVPINSAECYQYPQGGWVPTAVPPSSLSNQGLETGAAVLMNNGIVFAIGSSGNTGLYDYLTNQWTAGPTLPVVNGKQLGMSDGAASLLINGNVLLGASPLSANYQAAPPLSMFEFDGVNLIPQPQMPGTDDKTSAILDMLMLPSGELFVTFRTPNPRIYIPDGTYNPAWQPVIKNASTQIQPGSTYRIDGTLFNGMSQGAMYGDDAQAATNYPLIRLTNPVTNHVFYCRTHDHSSMGVAQVGVPVYTYYDVPNNVEPGYNILQVVTNGIPSQPYGVVVNPNVTPTAKATPPYPTINSGKTVNIALTSNLPNTTFTWDVPVQSSGVTGQAGSGATLTATLSVPKNSKGVATYTVIPMANGIQGRPVIVNIYLK